MQEIGCHGNKFQYQRTRRQFFFPFGFVNLPCKTCHARRDVTPYNTVSKSSNFWLLVITRRVYRSQWYHQQSFQDANFQLMFYSRRVSFLIGIVSSINTMHICVSRETLKGAALRRRKSLCSKYVAGFVDDCIVRYFKI